ncbi:MAG: hypothetical protein L7U72_17730 [Rubripirellula sp.]|nr:hypothetical protein [Rubripirellula sp.]
MFQKWEKHLVPNPVKQRQEYRRFKIGTEFIKSLTSSQGISVKPSPRTKVGLIDFSTSEGSIHPHVVFESGDAVLLMIYLLRFILGIADISAENLAPKRTV